MSWCTTSDLDRFMAAAVGYLRSRTAENILLLSAAQAARSGWRTQVAGQQAAAADPGLLFGWWEPPDGGEPRGAFVHDPPVPLLISGMTPEMAAALAATLARMGRNVYGVDAPTEVAEPFAAAWSQRAGTTVRGHKNCRVYRLTGLSHGTQPQGTQPQGTQPRGTLSRVTPPQGTPAVPGTGAWPSSEMPGPAGRLRVAGPEDLALLADWLTAFATEAAERIGSSSDLAADLISYGGAVFLESARGPMALATLTRPVAGTVRIAMVYTLPEHRRGGYASALTLAVSRALLAGTGPGDAQGILGAASGRVNEVVMITDKNGPDRLAGRFGYQLVGERAVLRFGQATGPLPRARTTGAMPRLPTGPLPRPPRLSR
ncbi:MAG: hypothetical protein ACRDOI_11255 [Trebonia sp.]